VRELRRMALLPNLAIQSVSAYFDYTIYYAVFIACFCGIADLLFFNIFIYFKALEQIKSKLYNNNWTILSPSNLKIKIKEKFREFEFWSQMTMLFKSTHLF